MYPTTNEKSLKIDLSDTIIFLQKSQKSENTQPSHHVGATHSINTFFGINPTQPQRRNHWKPLRLTAKCPAGNTLFWEGTSCCKTANWPQDSASCITFHPGSSCPSESVTSHQGLLRGFVEK